MRLEVVSVDDLVPCQPDIRMWQIARLGQKFNPSLYYPVAAVQDGTKFLLGGGHHRSYLIHLASGCKATPVCIVENEKDIRYFCDGTFKIISSVDGFRRMYALNSHERIMSQKKLALHVKDMTLQTLTSNPIIEVSETRELLECSHDRSRRGLVCQLPPTQVLDSITADENMSRYHAWAQQHLAGPPPELPEYEGDT